MLWEFFDVSVDEGYVPRNRIRVKVYNRSIELGLRALSYQKGVLSYKATVLFLDMI